MKPAVATPPEVDEGRIRCCYEQRRAEIPSILVRFAPAPHFDVLVPGEERGGLSYVGAVATFRGCIGIGRRWVPDVPRWRVVRRDELGPLVPGSGHAVIDELRLDLV